MPGSDVRTATSAVACRPDTSSRPRRAARARRAGGGVGPVVATADGEQPPPVPRTAGSRFGAVRRLRGRPPRRGAGAGRAGRNRTVCEHARARARAVSGLVARPAALRDHSSFGSIDGGFGAPTPLTEAATVGAPQLAVAPNGAALAAWIEIHGARDIVRAAARPAGGRFGRPYTLLGRGQATVVTAAIGAGNDLAIVAVRNGKLISRARPRRGHWGPVRTLTTARGGTQWQLTAAIDAGGHVQVAWLRDQLGRGGFPRRRSVEVASAARQHGFGSVQTLAGDLADPPVLLASPDGWAVAYAEHDAATPTVAVARVRTRRNGVRFGTAVDASPLIAGLGDVSIAADPESGRLLTGWVAGGGGSAALAAWGGPFAALEPVTPAEGASQLNFVAAPLTGRFTAAVGGLVGVLALLGGSWFPISGHGFLHDLAQALPSYWLVQASHEGIGEGGWGISRLGRDDDLDRRPDRPGCPRLPARHREGGVSHLPEAISRCLRGGRLPEAISRCLRGGRPPRRRAAAAGR
jgi:hypothetical protein